MEEIGAYIEANRAELEAWGLSVCDEITEAHGALLKVPASVRVKDPQSARGKQIRKAYEDPVRNMTDLVGVRFVVLTSTDLLPIRNAIEQSSSWSAVQARDPGEEIEKDPDTFGYQSHHYEVRSLPSGASTFCCEVQVRTLLQHAIAELSHDAMYKTTRAVPSQARRLVARSMALMETTDELLCRAMEAVRESDAPGLAVQRVASELTRPLNGADGRSLVEELLSAYATEIDGHTADALRTFVRDNGFVLDKLRGRLDQGLFAYPPAALLSYWLVERLERAAISQWPFPGSRAELMKIFSDMGIAE
jgi:putative GTP pyrophosphokinase